MESRYLGRISYTSALEAQDIAVRENVELILGFESEPVVTLGLRGTDDDLVQMPQGIPVIHVDRGGQATLHDLGQLVIFPVVSVKRFGVRNWVCHLSQVTRCCLGSFGIEAEWREDQPGLYTAGGKIASLGVRIRRGVSTHGIAINVRNDLSHFNWIRACGIAKPRVARIGETIELKEVFAKWVETFDREADLLCSQLTR